MGLSLISLSNAVYKARMPNNVSCPIISKTIICKFSQLYQKFTHLQKKNTEKNDLQIFVSSFKAQ